MLTVVAWSITTCSLALLGPLVSIAGMAVLRGMAVAVTASAVRFLLALLRGRIRFLRFSGLRQSDRQERSVSAGPGFCSAIASRRRFGGGQPDNAERLY